MLARLLMLTLVLWCNLQIIGIANAQEEKDYMYAVPKETKGEEDLGNPIYTGLVIAYGRRITSPMWLLLGMIRLE